MSRFRNCQSFPSSLPKGYACLSNRARKFGILTLASLFLQTAPALFGADVSEASSLQSVRWTGFVTNAQSGAVTTITADASETPDLFQWAKHAGELCAEWYPKLTTLLAGDGFEAPQQVRLVFRKGMEGVASTSAGTISISANYVRRATNDFGMVIHELVHVVQSYPSGVNPGWLVEGIADYVRLTQFEPNAKRPRIDPDRASYRDSYKTTALFFDWVQKNYDPQLVRELNRAAREGSFKMELFKQRTGKTIDELWAAFAETLRLSATL